MGQCYNRVKLLESLGVGENELCFAKDLNLQGPDGIQWQAELEAGLKNLDHSEMCSALHDAWDLEYDRISCSG